MFRRLVRSEDGRWFVVIAVAVLLALSEVAR